MKSFWYVFWFWLVLTAIWTVLIFSIDVPNIVAGGILAAITTWATSYMLHRSRSHFALPHGWTHAFVPIPLKIVTDTGTVASVLLRRIAGEDTEGELIHVPFDPRTGSPEDAARQALVIEGISITPNTVAVEPEDDSILVHQLMPSPPERRDPKWPV